MIDLAYLDDDQRRAVLSPALRTRVLAGAGSGKTRVLTARAAWLVDQGVPPHRICAVTFSKKAAEELRRRVGRTLDTAQVGTLHALGYLILRAEIPQRRVCEVPVALKLMRRAYGQSGVRLDFSQVRRQIALYKGAGQALSEAAERVMAAYDTELEAERCWDFDDLILRPMELLAAHDGLRTKWSTRWAHLLVDEVQDTAPRQWALLAQLVRPGTDFFVVGDASQSCYAFRGADVAGMLEQADRTFGTFLDTPLATNYRSREPVTELANRVIVGKPGAVLIRSHRGEPGLDVVRHLGPAADRAEEAVRIAEALEAAAARGVLWRDMAILTRTNAQTEPLEATLLQRQIPARVVGAIGFYNRREILDCLAYLRLSQGWDVDALDRIFNRPSRYLGEAFRKELAAQGGWQAVAGGARPRFSRGYMNQRLGDLVGDVRALQRAAADGMNAGDLVEYVLDGIGYRKWLVGEEPGVEDEVKGDNLDALVLAARRHATVGGLLSFAAQCQRRAEEAERTGGQDGGGPGRVQLLTVHKAKGLEWGVVVVAGVVPGLLPHRMGDPEEERRIFYVAVTRARDELCLAAHGSAPSCFWRESGGPPWRGDEVIEEGDRYEQGRTRREKGLLEDGGLSAAELGSAEDAVELEGA